MYNCIRFMKKVLIVFNHPAPYKVRLFNELSKTFELHVIFERDKAKDRQKGFYYENEYRFFSHRVKGIPLGKENFISKRIVRHIKNRKYDLIIMNGYSTFAEMKTIRYLKKNNIPYVFYINGGIIKPNECKFKKNLKTKYISGAAAYLSPDENSNKYLTYYGADEKLIYNYPYSTVTENELTKLPKVESVRVFDKVFVSSGQLIKRKNYLELVKEWKNYPENYGLYIFGDGPEKLKINNFIRKNHMKNVVLTGFLPRRKMLDAFNDADVFLFPSNEDIYGHVINEALSQGIPVISTKKVNASLKLIKDKYNGFLLDELKGQELKDAIEYCLNNNLAENCLNSATPYTIEKSANAHVEILNEVLK